MPPKPTKTKIKTYLKAHGHDPAKVNGKTMASDEQTRTDLCDLHGITRTEYARSGL